MRNYPLLAHLSQLSDDVLVGINEVAALTDLAPRTIQQRRLPFFPQPVPGVRRLRWRLGDIRKWMSQPTRQPSATSATGTSRLASRQRRLPCADR